MMQINRRLPNMDYYSAQHSKSTTASDFKVSQPAAKKEFGITDEQILDCYYKICKAYPNVTFKMSDIETACNSSPPSIGYKGSSHQQGENFSVPGQYSIIIDVGVLKQMVGNESYIEDVYGTIKNILANYKQTAQSGKSQGFEYCHAELRHENGRLSTNWALHQSKASTDEELKELWKDCPGQEKISLPTKLYYEKIINSAKNNMQDTFFSMIDQANQRKNKIFP